MVFLKNKDDCLDLMPNLSYALTMAKRHSNHEGNFESMFLRLEELVLANSGEDEFEEVFKLLIAKLWAERFGKAELFRVMGEKAETFTNITSLLRHAEKSWPGVLEPGSQPLLTPEHLQICVQALACHNISDNSLEVLDGFFEFMVSRAAKGSKGQYFTPRYVVEFCVRMLKPTKDDLVLDPACGSGGFLFHALDFVRSTENLTSEALQKYCQAKLWGFDIDPRAVRVAKTLMILAGDEYSNILRLNSLLSENYNTLFPITDPNALGGLTVEDVTRARLRHHKGFDVILTNPPFAGEVLEKDILESYEVSRGKSRIERDVLFIERCINLLRPNGRMAMILPHNKFASSEFNNVRRLISKKCRILSVVGLGRNTFLPHTHQKASVLFVQRRASGEAPNQDEKILFAVSERDGKNSKGQINFKEGRKLGDSIWTSVDHDFTSIVDEFRSFMLSEKINF